MSLNFDRMGRGASNTQKQVLRGERASPVFPSKIESVLQSTSFWFYCPAPRPLCNHVKLTLVSVVGNEAEIRVQ